MPSPDREYVQNGMIESTQSFSIQLRLQTGTWIFCRSCLWATVEHILRNIERDWEGSTGEGKRQKEEEKKEKEWLV